MEISLEPKKVSLFFLAIAILLTLAHLVNFLFAFYYFERVDISTGYFSIFNLDAERNVPTLYASVSILFCSVLLSVIGTARRRMGDKHSLYWFGLAFIFLFLAVDESSALHEYLIYPVQSTLNTSGLLFYAWIIPYSILLLIFLLVYIRFMFNLPRKTMVLFIISGGIFVAGAIGFEAIGGLQADTVGTRTVSYGFITMFEELLEMVGIVLFIYSLLTYIDEQLVGLSIGIRSKKS